MAALRGAIVGFGNVAQHGHWPAYRESDAFQIVAVVESSEARRMVASRLDPDVRVYRSLAELARQGTIDFVDICTPPAVHAAEAAEALRNGWHVLCEKPLTLDLERYRQLRELTERSGRVLFTVHNWRRAPIVRAALEVIAGDAVGAIRRVDLFTWRSSHCKGVSPGPAGTVGNRATEDWRLHRSTALGGVLVDHGWHAFYLAMNLAGAEPLRVRATMHLPSGEIDVLEDSVDAIVAFAHAEAHIHLTWRASVRRNLIVVGGERGTMVLDDDRLLVMPRDGTWSERVFDAPLSAGSHHADWFGGVLHAFVEEVGERTARGANLREAGWCVALADACYRAARGAARSVDVTFERSAFA